MLLTIPQLQAIQDRVNALPAEVTAQLTHNVPNTPGKVGHIELTSTVLAVLAERARQRAIWGDTHDDEAHDEGELGAAAAVLALPPGAVEWLNGAAPHWAVEMRRKLANNRYGALVRATALLISEPERLHRAQSGQTFTELQRLEGADDGQKFDAGHPLTEFLAHAPSDIVGLLEHLKAVDEAYLHGRPEPVAWCQAENVIVGSVDREGLCHCGGNVVKCESLGDAELAVELLGAEREEWKAEVAAR